MIGVTYSQMMEPPSDPVYLNESHLAGELVKLFGAGSARDLLKRLTNCPVFTSLNAVRELRSLETPKASAEFLSLQLKTVLDRAPAGDERDALLELASFVTFPRALDRRANAAERLNRGKDDRQRSANAFRYHEGPLAAMLASLLIEEQHATEMPARQVSEPFPTWLQSWDHGLGSWPTAGPSVKVLTERTLDDAAVVYPVPHPTSDPEVRIRELVEPSERKLPEELVASVAERSRELKALGGRDLPKLSVDLIQLPQRDSNLLTIDCRQEPWTTTKAFHDVISKRPDDHGRLSRWAAEVSHGSRWPSILCLHGSLTLWKDGNPYGVWTQRRKYDPDTSTFYPGRWSCSFEEQIEPGESFVDAGHRALSEELLGPDSSSQISTPLIGVILEQSILNIALLSNSYWPGSWEDFVKAYATRTDPTENYQMIALPLTRESMSQCAANHDIPQSLRTEALTIEGSPEVFIENEEWRLHPTSLTRFALALWAVEARASMT